MINNIKHTIFRNTITSYINLMLGMMIGIISTRFIYFALQDEMYGFWALLWGIFGYALLLDFGFGVSIQKYTAEMLISKEIKKLNELVSTVIGCYIMMSLIVIVFTIISFYYFDVFFKFKNYSDLVYSRKAFLIFGLGFALVFPTGAIPEILIGLNRLDIKNYISIIFQFFSLMGIYMIFKYKYSIIALTILILLTSAISNLVMLFFVKSLIPEITLSIKGFRIRAIKNIGNFSFYSYLLSIATLILYKTDTVVLGVFVGMNSVAVYQIGTRISEILNKLSSQFQIGLGAIAASLNQTQDLNKIKWILLKSTKVSTFIGVGFFIILILLARQILFLWLKSKSEEAVMISYIMLTSVLVIILFRSTSFKFLRMVGMHRQIAIIMLAECLINIVMSIILVYHWGAIGVALGTLIPNVFFSVFVVFPVFTKFSEMSMIYYLKKVYFPVFYISIPAICFIILFNILVTPYECSVIQLCMCAVGGGLIYLIFGFFFYFNREEKEKYITLIPVLNNILKKIKCKKNHNGLS